MRKALYTDKNKCLLCPHNCVINEGKLGICGVRGNISGEIYTFVYSKPCSIAVDPIEKKPLYHFFPGNPILSFGTVGCNLFCKGCQNWEIARGKPDKEDGDYPPEKIVDITLEKGCAMIAYTYTEPTVFYEYMYDTAKLAGKKGLKNVIVSNGYINKEPLRELCKIIDAANIDLKFFNKEKYKEYANADFDVVLDSLKILKQEGVWIEITNLVIPGLSDDLAEFEEMCKWIKQNLGGGVPLHIIRFFPHYKLKEVNPTSVEKMKEFEKIAEKYLNFVYLGNVHGESNTFCVNCKDLLIKREGYSVEISIEKGKCKKCGENVPGEF